MKEQILQISDKLRDNKITNKEAKTELCFLFGVTNSIHIECCSNPNISEMKSQNTDCDGDYENCTITYCTNCKQTLNIEP